MTIRELLEKYGMSQTGLAKRFGIPLRTVQNWCSASENEKRRCNDYILNMIVEILENERKGGK